jgi:hypothetical protein
VRNVRLERRKIYVTVPDTQAAWLARTNPRD